MNIKDVFDLAVQVGIDNDPRGRKKIEKMLARKKSEYQDLPKKKQVDFDLESLENPYLDSGIHFGDYKKEVKRVLVGVDIDTAEVLLAKELERSGKKIDLIIAHHPLGKALATLSEVMDLQTDVLARAGVPESIAEKLLDDRTGQVFRSISPANHQQPIDAAKLLDIPIMNIHTPADNCVWNFLEKMIEKNQPETLGDLLNDLKEIPEYKTATMSNSGPVLFSGQEKSKCGKILVGMTGGTNGSDKAYQIMSHYGIGTVLDMHIPEKSRDEAIKNYLNIVIAGHIASDSLGMNLILDELEKEQIEVVSCSGLIRHKRN